MDTEEEADPVRHYLAAPGASIHMTEDPLLVAHMEEKLRSHSISTVIETGTFDGTGSTKFLANLFTRLNMPPRAFYTIEVDFNFYLMAKVHLMDYPFVTPLWGCSVDIEQAADWMQRDDMLLHPDVYPEIYIDHTADAIKQYTQEVRGSSAHRQRPEWAGEGLLAKLLEQHKFDQPLIVLDSAGGIGLLEFEIVQDIMGLQPYWLLLDDVHHIKHYRSLQRIKNDLDFDVLISSTDKWAFGVYDP